MKVSVGADPLIGDSDQNMGQELKYKISFAADRSGLDAAAGAMRGLNAGSRTAAGGLDSLGARSLYAQQAMMGVQQAAQGNIFAVMGLARSVRALWMAFAAGSGPIGVIIIVLMAVYKALTHFTEKYNESAKASLEAADKTAEFSKALNDLREKTQAVTYSLERQKQALENLGAYYDDATTAAEKYTDAQKKTAAARTSIALARVDIAESAGLLRAAGKPTAVAKVKLQAEIDRAGIEHAAKETDLLFEKAAIQRKATLTREAMRGLEQQRAPAPAVAAAEKRISELQEQRAGARQDPKLYLKLTNQIIDMQNQVKALNQQERERIDALNAQLEAKNSLLHQLALDLADNENLRAALDGQNLATQNRLKLQEKINAENARDLALTAQKKALEKSLADAQVTGAKALADAKKKEETLITQAAAAKKRVETGALSPEETIAEAKRKAARGLRSPESTAVLSGQKEILAGEDPKEVIAREKAVARAQAASKRLRGMGRPGLLDKERPMTSAERKIAAVLGAEKLRAAAAAATAARAAMELKQAGDIAAMRTSLETIKTTLEANLQLS